MVYTVEQVAEILQVSVQTVRSLIKRKEIKAFRVGSQLRVRKEDLDRYMSGQAL
jgi:excisionase family DNA binding protein